MTRAEEVCGSCDCSDPTTMPGLRAECSCGCHGRRKAALTRKAAAAPLTGWRVGDAGHTVFGPKREDGGAPEILLTGKRRDVVRLAAAALDLLEVARYALAQVEQDNAERNVPKERRLTETMLRAAIAKATGQEGR